MKKILLFVAALVLLAQIGCEKKPEHRQTSQLDTTLTVRYFGIEGKTALELLEVSHRVEKKSSSMGSFVKSIDGIKNRSNRFWLYYVNGKMPRVASDRYTTHDNDTVEWRLEKEYEEVK